MEQMTKLAVSASIELNILCILIMVALGIIARVYLKNEEKITSSRGMVQVGTCYGLYIIADSVYMLLKYNRFMNVTAAYILAIAMFLLVLVSGYLWFFYVAKRLEITKLQTKVAKWGFTLPIAVAVIFALATPFNGMLFSIDSDFGFIKGPTENTFSFFSFLYVVAALISALTVALRSEGERRRLATALFLCPVPVIAAFCLEPYTESHVLCLGYVLASLILFLYDIVINAFAGKRSREELDSERKKNFSLAVVNNLADDFSSLFYVEFAPEKKNDVYHELRIGDNLLAIAPDWNRAKTVSEKINLLKKNVPDTDWSEFYRKSRREVIVRELTKHKAYFVNLRTIVGGEVHLFQIKFSGIRNTDGKLEGFVCGVHNIDDETRKEIEKREEIEKAVNRRAAQLYERNRALVRVSSGVIDLLGTVVENRCEISGEHIQRVKAYTYTLANEVMKKYPNYGLTPERVRLIAVASPLHDIGKISIPDSILQKKGKLTDEEFEVMKTHCESGCEIIGRMRGMWRTDLLDTAMNICRYHHEKFDGSGYPEGLRGNSIPISAQIVSIADIYDALINDRAYKPNVSCDEAFRMITSGECGAFSEDLMDCFRGLEKEFIKCTEDPFSMFGEVDTKVTDLGNDLEVFTGTRILLVEDNELTLEINREILEVQGATVISAADGLEAIRCYQEAEDPFDMILMDITMPVMDGIQATSAIRALEKNTDRSTVIVGLTADNTQAVIEDMFEAGADDCVGKPLVITELAKILISCMMKQSVDMEERLEKTAKIARTDALTKVKNITAYTDKVAELSEQMKENSDLRFGVVLCDIDDLKKENDANGHDSGDLYIKNSCRIICEVFEKSPVYRIGGDEFVVILQGQDYENAQELMDELRIRCEKASKITGTANGRASLSAGLALFKRDIDATVSDTVKRADNAMYSAKHEKKEKHTR